MEAICNTQSLLELITGKAESIGSAPIGATFFTYTLNTDFLERQLLPRLQDGILDRVQFPLEVIYGTGYSGHKLKGYQYKYTHAGVNSPGCIFHPKVYVIRWKTEVLTLIGSGNLTECGMNRNKEVFFCLDHEPIALINGLKVGAQSKASRINPVKAGKAAEIWTGGPGKLSIAEQFFRKAGLSRKGVYAEKVIVVSPFFDESGNINVSGQDSFLGTLAAKTRDQKDVSIYLPAEAGSDGKWEVSAQADVFKPFKNASYCCVDSSNGYLHAKVVAVKVDGQWHILAGSPNCTNAGMMGRNVEVAVYLRANSLGVNLATELGGDNTEYSDIRFKAPKHKYEPSYLPIHTASVTNSGKILLGWNPGYSANNTKLVFGEARSQDVTANCRYREIYGLYLHASKVGVPQVQADIPLDIEELPLNYGTDEKGKLMLTDPLELIGERHAVFLDGGKRKRGKRAGHGERKLVLQEEPFEYEKKIRALLARLDWLKEIFTPDNGTFTTSTGELTHLVKILHEAALYHNPKKKHINRQDRCWANWVTCELHATIEDIARKVPKRNRYGKKLAKQLKALLKEIRPGKALLRKFES